MGDQEIVRRSKDEEPMDMEETKSKSVDEVGERLRQQLGGEFVSMRKGAGQQEVPYLTGYNAIRLMNDVFGYRGWSTQVIKLEEKFTKEESGKFTVGSVCTVRITLTGDDGIVFREDVGYGVGLKLPGLLEAMEKAGKEAYTDAFKRAARQFGEVTGNCMYDKVYLGRIGKLRRQAGSVIAFDEKALYHLESGKREDRGKRKADELETEGASKMKRMCGEL